jgi:hypothetical protein
LTQGKTLSSVLKVPGFGYCYSSITSTSHKKISPLSVSHFTPFHGAAFSKNVSNNPQNKRNRHRGGGIAISANAQLTARILFHTGRFL